MKLRYNFVANKVGNKTVAVATGKDLEKFNGYIKLNGSGAFIFNMLKQNTTKEEILSKFLKTYDATEQQAIETIDEFIDTLDKAGIIDND